MYWAVVLGVVVTGTKNVWKKKILHIVTVIIRGGEKSGWIIEGEVWQRQIMHCYPSQVAGVSYSISEFIS